MSQAKRNRLFVDRSFQRAFLLRAVFYWLACVLCLGMVMTTACVFPHAGDSLGTLIDQQWIRFVPAIVLALVLLPAMAYDMTRLTNRSAGPMLRLRRAMQDAAQGEQVSPLRFREGDFWRECADEFNLILARLQQAEAARQANSADQEELAEPASRAAR